MTGTARVRASTVARLTGYLLQAKNDPPRIGTALAQRRRHFPAFAREGQFLLDPFAFEEHADTVGIEKRRGKIEQPVERRAASRRKAHFRESASTSSTSGAPRIARTSPGRPAPLPRSIRLPAESGRCDRSCAESRMCRRHRSAIVL